MLTRLASCYNCFVEKTKKFFKFKGGELSLPVFFPDATRGFVKSIDVNDIELTKTNGLLVNTLHLYRELGAKRIGKFGGIKKFMDWSGAMISDSGGFQVGSLIKADPKHGHVTDLGATFHSKNGKSITLTPELSIEFQMGLGVDMVVALDDFDAPNASYDEIKKSVERTIAWAARSKAEFIKICKKNNLTEETRPYILGVVQGGRYKELREYCAKELIKIGFDGFGYGGDGKGDKSLNYDMAKVIADCAPDEYFLYGLGVGKPEDVVILSGLGYNIFDCVLPTRDARHGRLYIYNFDSIKDIDLSKKDFYSYLNPDKQIYLDDDSKISKACDCLACTKYSKGYLAHLFKMHDFTAGRLATIHNLRFYSILMEKLRS